MALIAILVPVFISASIASPGGRFVSLSAANRLVEGNNATSVPESVLGYVVAVKGRQGWRGILAGRRCRS